MVEEEVLKYLENTNRPYSVNNIVLNLHDQFGKGAIQKALDTLVANNFVLEKIYGKQKIYVIRQSDDNQKSINKTLKGVGSKV
jgi:hypothetical protein